MMATATAIETLADLLAQLGGIAPARVRFRPLPGMAPEQVTVLHEEDTLEGGAVLPGFALPLREFFAELDQQPLQ